MEAPKEVSIINVGFRCGYAEDSQVGISIFSSTEGPYENPLIAVSDLAAYLAGVFLARWQPPTNHCVQCWAALAESKPTISDFQEWLESLAVTPLVAIPYDEDSLWSPQEDPDFPVYVLLPERAEVILAERVQKSSPDLFAKS